MIIDILLLLVGIFFVWLGSEGVVKGSVQLAEHFGVSPLIVGLTVVAIGTSMPELVVSVLSSIKGHNEISLGNVLGSNIINIAVILGLAALIKPIAVARIILVRDMPIVVFITLLVVGLALLGNSLGRFDGLLLLALFVSYILFTIHLAVRDNRRTTSVDGWEQPELKPTHIVFLFGGLLLLILGAEGMVRGAVSIAQAMGVSEAIIGMTIVALGTSIPELAASAVAARRGQSELAIGNVVGSNIFNATFILGAAATIRPIDKVMVGNEVNMLFFVLAVLLVFALMRIGRRLGRIDGLILLGFYCLSVWALLAW